jgi:GNAT superfamily N-acetyltransferase
MQIVRAKPEDAAVLTEIAHAAKRHWGYPERWIQNWRDILTMRPEFIAANVTYCAMKDARVVGFYLLTNESDGLHLDHLWIAPDAMGRGIGRALFEHAVEQARKLGREALKIEADPNAEGFYRRMGARRVGVTVTRIEDQRRELPLLQYDLEGAVTLGRPAPPRPVDSKIFLGKYRVSAAEIELVGEPGDSPLVYEGEEIDSGKKVVVEAIPAASLKVMVREQLEAKAIAAKKLNHVNIHTLYDFGVEDDHLVYITEDFDGTLVEEWVNTHGPMPVGPVLRIASQVVSALGAAGFHRIVHDAINPSNLVLVPGQTTEGEWPLVKVLHFGGTPKFSAAAFDKSLQYASPEQLQHGVVDFRSEIYSLGSTMWFLLTGAPPPMAPSGPMAVQPTKAGLAADKVSAIPTRIRRLLVQMLSVNPDARPRDPLAFYLQLQDCLTEMEPRETMSRPLGVPADLPTRTVGLPAYRRIPMKVVALAALFLAITLPAALVLPGYLRHRRFVHAKDPRAFASATLAPTAAPAESPAPVKSGPQQQPAESAVKVTLLNFTPMAGAPGGKDFKIATLTFKIEASAPVTVTEASFYVDSNAFDDGPAHNAPITLLIHTGIFLGPPGTKVDPAHPLQRTVWLKSQENLYPNWLLAYNQTENATFRWTIGGQPVGGSAIKPLHKAWP